MKITEIDLSSLELPRGWARQSYLAGERRGAILRGTRDADVLRIPLGALGRHEVRIGLYRPEWEFASMEVKLSGDRFWREVRPTHLINDSGGGLHAGLLGVFDLSGRDLLIRPAQRFCPAIGYVRTAPTAQVPVWTMTRRNVGAVCDVHSILSGSRIESADDLRATIAPFADSDFDRICWGTTAGLLRALYFSDATEYLGQGQAEFVNELTKHAAQVMEGFRKRGEDPLRIVVDFTHEIGLELWASDRISHTYPPGTFCDNFANRFFLENQDKTARGQDGSFTGKLSLAYPEVRELKTWMLAEQAGYGVDGIYIDFQRFPGIIGYEPLVADSFKAETGRNPFEIPPLDRDWLVHKAGYVTEFMRQLRKRVGNLPICVQVFNGLRISPDVRIVDENLCQGLDLPSWIDEGLVDMIAPARSRDYQPLDYLRYSDMVADSVCQLWACLGQHDVQLFPDDYHWATYFGGDPDSRFMPIADLDPLRMLRSASDAYHQGVEGVFLWEAGDVHTVLPRWEFLRRLGHREELKKMFGPPIGPFDGRLAIGQEKPVLQG